MSGTLPTKDKCDSLKVFLESLPAEGLNINLTPMYERLQFMRADEAKSTLDAAFTSLCDVLGRSPALAAYVIIDVKLAAARMIRRCGVEPVDVAPQLCDMGDVKRYCTDSAAAAHYATSVLLNALTYRDRYAPTVGSEAVRRACEYVRANLHCKELSMNKTAQQVSLSDHHFCTLFHREMGESFIDYVTALRIEKAKEYLTHSGLSSAEIAERIGYGDPGYFRERFRRLTGMSPREFRSRNEKRNFIASITAK